MFLTNIDATEIARGNRPWSKDLESKLDNLKYMWGAHRGRSEHNNRGTDPFIGTGVLVKLSSSLAGSGA
jgi:hypothetical protein